MREVPLESVPIEQLQSEITEYAGHLAAAECWWLLRVAEFDRRDGWKPWGCRSCAHWLSWRCGIDLRTARGKLRVAHGLSLFPRIREEFEAGRLSYSKARALMRVAGPDTEAELVEMALHATAAHVEAISRGYRRAELAHERANGGGTPPRRRVDFADDPDDPDLAMIVARLTPEEADLVHRALGEARTQGRSLADALVLMAESFIANGEACRPGHERTTTMVNVDEEVLLGDDSGTATIVGGDALAPETARRLACDSSLTWVLRRNGVPIDISTKHASIPRALRRLVRLRDDGRCQFRGCAEHRFTDVHHIRHRADGGSNELTNLATLCWFHHRLVHEGGWSLAGTPGIDLVPVRPDGHVLADDTPVVRASDHLRVPQHNHDRGLAIDPSTSTPQWHGEHLDLGWAVTSLWYSNHPELLRAENELSRAA